MTVVIIKLPHSFYENQTEMFEIFCTSQKGEQKMCARKLAIVDAVIKDWKNVTEALDRFLMTKLAIY